MLLKDQFLSKKMDVFCGNPTLVVGISPIYPLIILKIPNFPEISDKISNFRRNLVI